jgi:hypothetical protein
MFLMMFFWQAKLSYQINWRRVPTWVVSTFTRPKVEREIGMHTAVNASKWRKESRSMPLRSHSYSCLFDYLLLTFLLKQLRDSCEYLAHKFLSTNDGTTGASAALLLAKHAVCLCDDDNDLEMALACQHAYIPGISSKSMAETIGKNPTRFTVTTTTTLASSLTDTLIPPVQEGTTSATEAALSLVLERIQST